MHFHLLKEYQNQFVFAYMHNLKWITFTSKVCARKSDMTLFKAKLTLFKIAFVLKALTRSQPVIKMTWLQNLKKLFSYVFHIKLPVLTVKDHFCVMNMFRDLSYCGTIWTYHKHVLTFYYTIKWFYNGLMNNPLISTTVLQFGLFFKIWINAIRLVWLRYQNQGLHPDSFLCFGLGNKNKLVKALERLWFGFKVNKR